jgi:hypothetical protein
VQHWPGKRTQARNYEAAIPLPGLLIDQKFSLSLSLSPIILATRTPSPEEYNAFSQSFKGLQILH